MIFEYTVLVDDHTMCTKKEGWREFHEESSRRLLSLVGKEVRFPSLTDVPVLYVQGNPIQLRPEGDTDRARWRSMVVQLMKFITEEVELRYETQYSIRYLAHICCWSIELTPYDPNDLTIKIPKKVIYSYH